MFDSRIQMKVDRDRSTRILQNPINPGSQPPVISGPAFRRSVFCMQLGHMAQTCPRSYTAQPPAQVSPLRISHGSNSESLTILPVHPQRHHQPQFSLSATKS